MTANLLPIFGILVVTFGFIFLLIGLRLAGSSEVERRMHDFMVEPPTPQSRWEAELIDERPETSGSLINRTIVPLFRRLGDLIGRIIPTSSIQELDRKLVIAGNPMRMRGREFYGIRILFIVLGAYLAYMIINRFSGPAYFLIALFMAILCFFLPKLWLNSVTRKRQNSIRKDLPDALDMLSVCADAGLGFDQSLKRVSENWDSPLSIEFSRVVAEMGMGESRASAMRSMSERLDVPEVTSFVAVILQSYELGMGIADTLHAQANQMRIERRYWAQEQARKIPTKMLFPLMFLILPAMFAVILGPTIPALRDLFQGGLLAP